MEIVLTVYRLLEANQYSQPIAISQLQSHLVDMSDMLLKRYLYELNKVEVLEQGENGEYWLGERIEDINLGITADELAKALLKQQAGKEQYQRKIKLSPEQLRIVQTVINLLAVSDYSQPATKEELRRTLLEVNENTLKDYLYKLEKANLLERGNTGEYWLGERIRDVVFPADMEMTDEKIQAVLEKQREGKAQQNQRLSLNRTQLKIVQTVISFLLGEFGGHHPVTRNDVNNALADVNVKTLNNNFLVLERKGVLVRGKNGEYLLGKRIRDVNFPVTMGLSKKRIDSIMSRQDTNKHVPEYKRSLMSTKLDVDDLLPAILDVMQQHEYKKPVTIKQLQIYFSEQGCELNTQYLRRLLRKCIDEGILELGSSKARAHHYWMGPNFLDRLCSSGFVHDYDDSILAEGWRRQRNGKQVAQTIHLTDTRLRFLEVFMDIYEENDFAKAVHTQQLKKIVPLRNLTKVFSALLNQKILERVRTGYYVLGEKFAELDPESLGMTVEEHQNVIDKNEKTKQREIQHNLFTLQRLLIELNGQLDHFVQNGSISSEDLKLTMEEIARFPKQMMIDQPTNELIFTSLIRLHCVLGDWQSLTQIIRFCQQTLTSLYNPLFLSAKIMNDKLSSLEEIGYIIPPAARIHYLLVERINQGLGILAAKKQTENSPYLKQEIALLYETTKMFNEHLDYLWKRGHRNPPQQHLLQLFLNFFSDQLNLQRHDPVSKQSMRMSQHPSSLEQRQELYQELLETQMRMEIFDRCGLDLSNTLLTKWHQPDLVKTRKRKKTLFDEKQLTDIYERLSSSYPPSLVDEILFNYQMGGNNPDILKEDNERYVR